jgi:hypothetical protein
VYHHIPDSGQTRLAAAQDGGKVFHKSGHPLVGWGLRLSIMIQSGKHGSGMASAGYAAGHFTSLCVANAVRQEKGRLNEKVKLRSRLNPGPMLRAEWSADEARGSLVEAKPDQEEILRLHPSQGGA